MNAAEAVEAARAAGIEIALDGDDLALSAASAPPAATLEALSRHKAEIVALLRPGRDGWSGEGWQVYFDERAGIAEFDGGLPRAEAEAQAFACCVVEWLNRHPVCSPPGRCHGCGGREDTYDKLLPYGTEDRSCVAAFALLGSMARSPKGRSDRSSFKPWNSPDFYALVKRAVLSDISLEDRPATPRPRVLRCSRVPPPLEFHDLMINRVALVSQLATMLHAPLKKESR